MWTSSMLRLKTNNITARPLTASRPAGPRCPSTAHGSREAASKGRPTQYSSTTPHTREADSGAYLPALSTHLPLYRTRTAAVSHLPTPPAHTHRSSSPCCASLSGLHTSQARAHPTVPHNMWGCLTKLLSLRLEPVLIYDRGVSSMTVDDSTHMGLCSCDTHRVFCLLRAGVCLVDVQETRAA